MITRTTQSIGKSYESVFVRKQVVIASTHLVHSLPVVDCQSWAEGGYWEGVDLGYSLP